MKTQEEEDGKHINQTDGISYIPKAHVQFLEQAGIRVVPISYTDSKENITSILDQVNGVYMPGDSHKSIMNPIYHKAFTSILDYVIDHNKNMNDYFPMFMMGKSSQIFV
jgi:gamma-glutamyl-gamma-aminobutyrate hydrolase PuuD